MPDPIDEHDDTVQGRYDAGVAVGTVELDLTADEQAQSLLLARRRLAYWAGRVEALRGRAGVRGIDYRSGCPAPDCVCQVPMRPCGEWMGIDGETGRWCPQCGWARHHHPGDPS